MVIGGMAPWPLDPPLFAFEKACNLGMTLKVIQGHRRCCHLIGHIRFPISFQLLVYLYFAPFSNY